MKITQTRVEVGSLLGSQPSSPGASDLGFEINGLPSSFFPWR